MHAFTTLRRGVGSSAPPFDDFNLGNRGGPEGDDPGAVDGNRQALVEAFALPAPPRWLRQVHGTEVHRAGAGAPDAAADLPVADAAVTSVPGVVLAVLTADCLPVILAADDGSEVAVAHAGWRGLAAGVLERTLAGMTTPPWHVLAWMGPAAGPDAYEVGGDVHAAFVDRDPRAAGAFVATRPGHWHVDLYALARERLARSGVRRIAGGGLCTLSDPARFFSHRRDRRTGRMATVAWIDAPA